MDFKNFESLIKKIEEDLGSEFNQTFREERKKLAGLKNLPNQIIFSEFDKDKSEWVYNRGGKKEIQYHIYLRNNELGYGLGINSQRGSFNNDDPKEIANSFGNSFKEIYTEIKKRLPTYIFKIGSEDMLGRMNEEEFLLFGQSIPYNNDNKLSDLDYKNLIEDLKKQLDVYIMVFELNVLKKDKNLSREKKMKERQQILEYKKQIILQGPPGTGKTREAKFIAAEMLGLNNVDDLKYNDQFKLIQFHPSYTYEDFVRGIVAESKGEKIEYKNVNKALGEFAQKALDNFYDSQKAPDEISKESWVSNELKKFSETILDEIEKKGKFVINATVSIFGIDSDAFRYNGNTWDTGQKRMKFKDIILAYLAGAKNRQDIKAVIGISGRAKEHASYDFMLLEKFKKFLKGSSPFVKTPVSNELKNYILIIDEINRANLSSVLGELIYALEYRGEAVESMYAVDEDNKLILPPNLYIIGTMNTADRSVGHIDYAIRRRFAFIDLLPENLRETQGLETFDDILFNNVATLFDMNLSSEFEKKDVQLGHSYFIDKSNEKDGAPMFIRLEFEIKPILREYLKDGVLVGEDIKDKIDALAPSI